MSTRRYLSTVICLLFGSTLTTAAYADPDIAPRIFSNGGGIAIAGEPTSWAIDLDSINDFYLPIFSAGSVALQVDLPPGLEVTGTDVYRTESCSDESFATLEETIPTPDIACVVTEDVLSCSAITQFSGCARIRLRVKAGEPGTITIPPPGGQCLGDPNNDVIEDFEQNNNCTGAPVTVEVKPRPSVHPDWLQVSMWDSFARFYDVAGNDYIDAKPITMVDGTPVHALNEIVKHPQTADDYVLYRTYQSSTLSLGLLDMDTGITPLGETGELFVDAAFAEDGILYTVSLSGHLFTVNAANGAATQKCFTGSGSDQVDHTALVYDPVNGRLLQLADNQFYILDTENFPASADDLCGFLGTIPFGDERRMDYKVWAAEYHDGLIYAQDAYGQLFALLPDGGAMFLAELPQRMHGLVPLPAAPQVYSSECPADLYTSLSANDGRPGRKTMLFGINGSDTSIEFTKLLPFSEIHSLEFQNGILLGTGKASNDGSERVFRLDVCSYEILSSVPASIPGINALDITANGVVFGHKIPRPPFTFNNGLYILDVDSGVFTPVPSIDEPNSPKNADSMAIRSDGSLILGISDSWTWIDLQENYDSVLFQTPLSFGPGLDAGSGRNLTAMDYVRHQDFSQTDRAFYGLLQRAAYPPKQNMASKPNALVGLDLSQNVVLIGYLPSGLNTLTTVFNRIFSDGFEQPAPSE